jgi:hypothetical protein
MDKDLELQRIKEAVKTILDRNFPRYLEDMKKHWPKCPYHQTEMCQILKKGQNDYFQCFEFDEDCKPCGHKEWGI